MISFKPSKIFFSKSVSLQKKNKIKSIIFFAADENYFNLYGRRLITSLFKHNSLWGAHVHLYEPSKKTLNYLKKINYVTYSYEIMNNQYFNDVLSNFLKSKNISWQEDILLKLKAHHRSTLSKILAVCIKVMPAFIYIAPKNILIKHFKVIYFSCQRFIVLNELIAMKYYSDFNFLALDADSLINKTLPDFLRYKQDDISVCKRKSYAQAFLAGIIYMPHCGRRDIFLDCLSKKLNSAFSSGYLIWGLDQIILHKIIPKFKWQNLEQNLRCFSFRDDSIIWMAKGKTKDLKIFNKKFI